MDIDPQIRLTCTHWGIPPERIQAMYLAEGGTHDTFLRAVQCSIAVSNFAQAVEVACRTYTHRLSDFVQERGLLGAYVDYLGSFWAPIGVTNDPHGLNRFWAPNVKRFLHLTGRVDA